MRAWSKIVAVNIISCIVVATAILAGYYLFMHRDAPVVTSVVADGNSSMWRFDDRLGFANVASAKGVHTGYKFQVTYSIDEYGNRITPTPSQIRGNVLIMGCSFTFGDGVEDNEPFPYLLGQDYWRYYKVVNRSCMAYGTGQAFLILQEELAKQPLPKVALYCWITGHMSRNYRDKEWLSSLAAGEAKGSGRRRNPWFEIENGALVYKGVIGPEQGLERNEEFNRKERQLTLMLISEMGRICKQKGVPFFLVALPTKGHDSLNDSMLPAIRELGVAVLDFTDTCKKEDFLPNDGHPGPPAHRKIARAIAKASLF